MSAALRCPSALLNKRSFPLSLSLSTKPRRGFKSDAPGDSHVGDVFLTARQVRLRYGGVSDMTIYRWLRHPELGFCRPIVIGNRRYWRLSDLEEFERRRVGQRAETER
jgi:hypothetical protein